GVIVGTYSSIFFATPLLVTLRERTELVGNHTRKVMNRRKGVSAKAAAGEETGSPEAVAVTASAPAAIAPDKPAPGAKPIRPTGRPSGKRTPRQ
ncbi:MAG TPA: protein translocase subunit SecF, partial [Mycobacterium sp.]|nr:protein translocase subunit SecF [Mycobacterium sp.]